MANQNRLPDVVAEIYKLLDPLDSADRQKVVRSVMTLLGEEAGVSRALQPTGGLDGSSPAGIFGSKATRWMSQYGIGEAAISELFHKDGDKIEIIVSDVPGTGKKTKSHNCYLLSGVRALLASDEPKFSESDAVSLCKHLGCHDGANHAKIRSELGNLVAGSKASGFTLPAPGLRAAADLVKAMASAK